MVNDLRAELDSHREKTSTVERNQIILNQLEQKLSYLAGENDRLTSIIEDNTRDYDVAKKDVSTVETLRVAAQRKRE